MGTHVDAAAWTVTLVCGASGVGKSHIAVALARRYGVPLAEVDDMVTVVKALTTPEQSPTLHPVGYRHCGAAVDADADRRAHDGRGRGDAARDRSCHH